jgi:hypothetical protein
MSCGKQRKTCLHSWCSAEIRTQHLLNTILHRHQYSNPQDDKVSYGALYSEKPIAKEGKEDSIRSYTIKTELKEIGWGVD